MPRARLQTYLALIGAIITTGVLPRVAGSAASPDHLLSKPSQQKLTFVAAGDILGPYKSNLKLDDPALAKVISLIRSGDVAFANHEGSTFNLATFSGWIDAGKGNVVPPHSLATARAYKEMGLDLLSLANNHSTDWGVAGLLATDQTLEAIGIAHAGTGRSLAAARAPALFHSPKGRIALIASASTFTADAPAGDPQHHAGPRPGLNPLRVRRGSDNPGSTYEVSSRDRSAIIESITATRRSADFVAYSIHAHEFRGVMDSDTEEPADFLTPLFHDIVDAGANVVVRSGPHVVQGVEIYKGKPIFYGLGQLFMELPRTWVYPNYEGWDEATVNFPVEYYESAIASVEFRNAALRMITLYPLIIEAEESSPNFGIPKLAQGAVAGRILTRIQQRSAMFGTKLEIVNGVGVIRGPGAL